MCSTFLSEEGASHAMGGCYRERAASELHSGLRRRPLQQNGAAERFGISRKTAHKWVKRSKAEGLKGLEELSRRPRSRPWQTDKRIVEDLVALRKASPSKGPKKLLGKLRKLHRFVELPAESTVAHILDRQGLVKVKWRHHRAHSGCPKRAATAPNDIWAADYKGQFRLKNGQYCFPLTVSDLYSRFLLGCEAHPVVSMEQTIAFFLRLFREYGLPNRIRTDNGVPFASCALGRLSALQVVYIKYGVYPELIEPGKPQQNGIHERMHRALKQEATIPPASSLKAQQRKFDAFRRRNNEAYPRDVLDQSTPQELYYRSARTYDGKSELWHYLDGIVVKYVCRNGAMRWGAGKWVMVSTTLIGKYIGLEQIEEGKWLVYYRNILLGYLDEKQMRIMDGQGRLKRNEKV